MSIETHFDIAFIGAMARREKQIQQNYRPIIAVHKWFAPRPGTLFRGLTLAEFGDRPLSESFFVANDFAGRTIADPFMGGGTPLLEANRVGCGELTEVADRQSGPQGQAPRPVLQETRPEGSCPLRSDECSLDRDDSGAPLAFTFHCSASIPCPAEMGGSIHIHGTGSSIVDTIFVCRDRGQARRNALFEDLDGLSTVVRTDLAQLRAAGMTPSAGDIRCIAFGHLTRMAVWGLRHTWDSTKPTSERLNRVRSRMAAVGDPKPLIESLAAVAVSPAATAHGTPLFPDDQTHSFDAVSF